VSTSREDLERQPGYECGHRLVLGLGAHWLTRGLQAADAA